MSVCLKLHKRHLTGDSRQTSLARGAGEEQRENLLYVTKYYTAALFKKTSNLCNQKEKTETSMGAKRVPCGPQHTSVPGPGTREQDGHDSHPSAADANGHTLQSQGAQSGSLDQRQRHLPGSWLEKHILTPPRPTGSESLWRGPASCLTGPPGGSDAAKV